MGVNDIFRVHRRIRSGKFALLLLCLGLCLGVEAQVKTGLEVLRDRNFDILQGRRVGLVTNPSGVDRNLKSTVDIFYDSPQVDLVALYAPEHGVRGDKYAGARVEDEKDVRTSLPVYSLHGATR